MIYVRYFFLPECWWSTTSKRLSNKEGALGMDKQNILRPCFDKVGRAYHMAESALT
jgi:hypothetical protein